MVFAIKENLKKGINLLNSISNEQYSNRSVPPYYSSIGENMRHILDIFNCIFIGLEQGVNIDFSNRTRNETAQQKTASGIAYFNEIINKLQALNPDDFDKIIPVTDDLGMGITTYKYTLGAALIQAHSHAIHHFASIGFIVHQLGIKLPDDDFGYNPTTPKKNQ